MAAVLMSLGVHLQALYASKIISYAQGFMLLRQAAAEFGWTLSYGGIALMWRAAASSQEVSAGRGTKGSGALRRAFLELYRGSSCWQPGSFGVSHPTFLCVSYSRVHTARLSVPSAQTSRDLASGVPGLYSKFWGGVRRTGALNGSLGFLLLPSFLPDRPACYLRFIDFLSSWLFQCIPGKDKRCI